MTESNQVLKRIAASLRQTMEEVAARERAWSDAPVLDRAGEHGASLAALAETRRSLSERADAVAHSALVTDQELAACEAELRELAGRTESLRRQLADWGTRAIG
jgi:hypothetical protein